MKKFLLQFIDKKKRKYYTRIILKKWSEICDVLISDKFRV